MLLLKLTVVPEGDLSRAEEIGEMTVWNASGGHGVLIRSKGRPDRAMAVEGHRPEDGAWALVARALAAAGPLIR